MASLLQKTRDFFSIAAADVKDRVLLKLTGLLPSSPSTESIFSLPGVSNPPHYSEMLDGIPNLETHVNEGHDSLSEPIVSCPFCNRYFFEWLIDHEHFSIIGAIEQEGVKDPDPDFELPSSDQDGKESDYKDPRAFKHFIPREKKHKVIRREMYRRAQRVGKWIANAKANLLEIEANAITETADYADHDQYATLPRSQAKVCEWVMNNCHYQPNKLLSYPERFNLFVLPAARYMIRPGIPKFLIMRFESVIPNDIQFAIWQAWCAMRNKITKFERSQNRDFQPQLHLGIWQHYRKFPYVISDTIRQTMEAQDEIAKFMDLVRLNIAWRLWALLRRYDPATFERVMRVRDFLTSDQDFLEKLISVRHADFGGIFYAMAVKEGGSQRIHLDWMDHPGTYAWVITIGSAWVGGDLCFPQLGRKVPTRPGQVIAFQGRYLAHCASPSIGDRLVITCFTDRNLMNRALAAIEESLGRASKRAKYN